jgi:hypothetical protein
LLAWWIRFSLAPEGVALWRWGAFPESSLIRRLARFKNSGSK